MAEDIEKQNELLKSQVELRNKITEEDIKRSKNHAEYLELIAEETGFLNDQRAAAQAKVDFEKLNLEQVKQTLDFSRELTEKEKERLNAAQARVQTAQEENKQLDESIRKLREADEAAKSLGKSLAEAFRQEYAVNFMSTVETTLTALEGGVASLKTTMMEATVGIGSQMIDNMVGLSIEAHNAQLEFQRLTGANEELAASMVESYEDTRRFGATLTSMREQYSELIKGYNDFIFLNEETRESLAATGVALNKLGVSNADFTKGIVNTTKFMGMTAAGAKQFAIDLEAYSRALGVPPEILAQRYADVGPQLAKMGDQMGRSFKELARISKITQMEITDILNLTDKFDTFESAAEMTGKLNAALGGDFVNAMDMMMETNPAARFEAIRESILSTGLTFDTMSYYQRQFYAESLGLKDVGELALLLSGKMDMLDESINMTSQTYEEMAERTRDLQSIQDQFKNVIADATPIISEFAGSLQSLVNLMKEYPKITNTIIMLFMLWSVVMKVVIPLITMLGSVGTPITFMLSKMGVSTKKAADGMKKMSDGAKVAVGPMLAFGAAMLMVGGAVALAALGISQLVQSFENLTGDQAAAAVVSLVVFGAAFVAMGKLVLAGGALAGKGMIIFGAGLALTALGAIGLAFAFTMITDAFIKLFETLFGTQGIHEAMGSLLLFSVVMQSLAITLPLALPAMMGLAGAMGAISLAAQLAEGPITRVLSLINTLAETGLNEMAAAFTEIADAVNSIEGDKVVKFTALMTATAAVQTAQTIAENNPITALGRRIAGGGGGTGGTPEKMEVTLTIDGPALKTLIRGEAAKLDAEMKRRDLANEGMGVIK